MADPISGVMLSLYGGFNSISAYLLGHSKSKLQSRCPEDADLILIKRICAIEGDTVQTLPPYPIGEVKILPGHIWVEGIFVL